MNPSCSSHLIDSQPFFPNLSHKKKKHQGLISGTFPPYPPCMCMKFWAGIPTPSSHPPLQHLTQQVGHGALGALGRFLADISKFVLLECFSKIMGGGGEVVGVFSTFSGGLKFTKNSLGRCRWWMMLAKSWTRIVKLADVRSWEKLSAKLTKITIRITGMVKGTTDPCEPMMYSHQQKATHRLGFCLWKKFQNFFAVHLIIKDGSPKWKPRKKKKTATVLPKKNGMIC